MASLIYNSFWDDLAKGAIDADTDTFKCLLVTSAYTEDKDAHMKRSNVTNELAATGGYVAGGFAVTVTVTKDNANDRVDIGLGGFSVGSATITARKAVYYKSRGGAAAADELVAVVDFGSDVTSTNGTWSLGASTIRIQN
jgi:hypothetical protein